MALVVGFVAFVILDSPLGVAALIGGLMIEVGELYLWSRYLKRFRVQTGAEGLLGKRGVVIEACEPEGRVRVHGELWRARSEPGAAAGAEVEVEAVEGLGLVVAPTGRQGR